MKTLLIFALLVIVTVAPAARHHWLPMVGLYVLEVLLSLMILPLAASVLVGPAKELDGGTFSVSFVVLLLLVAYLVYPLWVAVSLHDGCWRKERA